MAPLTKDSELSSQPNPGNAGSGAAKPQPVAVEIPITVNGASTVAGGEKRQPFSETTQTVLVFTSGAVIRLTPPVWPGQLLFVTNEKSKKEVVCQVVKTKQNGSAGSYVELKFTEPTTDFWGIRLPGSASPSLAAPLVSTVAPKPAAPAISLEQKLAGLKIAAPPPTTPEPVQAPRPQRPPAPAPVSSAATDPEPTKPASPPAAQPSPQVIAFKPAAITTPAPHPTTGARVPTLSEFLAPGSNGPELKPPPKPLLAEEKKVLPAAPEKESKPGLGTVLSAAPNPAPGTATFDLGAEAVKIPSWLEPLARNSTPAPAKESGAASEPGTDTLASAVVPAAEPLLEPASALPGEVRAPNFGSGLPLDAQGNTAKSSGNAWKIILVILILLAAGAAAWYWYVNQPPKVSAAGNSPAEGSFESVPTAESKTNQPANASPGQPAVEKAMSSEAEPLNSPLNSPGNTLAVRPASNPTRETRTGAIAEEPSSVAASGPAAVVAPKKPALGNVRLAAPVVKRNAAADNNSSDPGLALNSSPSGDPTAANLLGSKGKQPTAPLPVGGDVKPARLLSSVPPVYPQLARAQRVGGDVTIDALVDQNGRVSAMKVVSGPGMLHQAALDAVKQWKYQPATLNDQPTAMHLTVTVQFRLQ